MDWISTQRVGQISGSRGTEHPDGPGHPETLDPQGWPLLNDLEGWGAVGFDEGANTEHNGRLYFFFRRRCIGGLC
jgi:hypothetical protein